MSAVAQGAPASRLHRPLALLLAALAPAGAAFAQAAPAATAGTDAALRRCTALSLSLIHI